MRNSAVRQSVRQGYVLNLADLGGIAECVEEKFVDGGVPIHGTSELGRIIRAAQHVGKEAAKPHDVSVNSRNYHDAYSLARLAQTLIPLDSRLLPKKRLRCLYDGDLNFWSSTRSLAKDTEWECLVAAFLEAGKLDVNYIEPDIQFSGLGRSIGIACKKVYSLSNAKKQISRGVKQIERSGVPGILALSLDHLFAKEEGSYSFFKQGDPASAQKVASHIIQDFAERLQINRMIEREKLVGTILYSHFFVQDRERPHLFIAVSAIRLTNRGKSSEATLVMNRLAACHAAWVERAFAGEGPGGNGE